MSFVLVVDAHGKQWVLNKAYIVIVSPLRGGDGWERGAQILLDDSSLDNDHINISGDAAKRLLLELGVMV